MKMIPDNFWNEIKDIFQPIQARPGRPSISARKALSGILYILENGSKWRCIPRCYGKPTTIHGTFMRWIRNGKFDELVERARQVYLANQKDFPLWYAIDSSSSKAPYARWGGKNSTDRGKRGIKKNIIVDRTGAPLGLSIGPANRHDSYFFKKTIDNLLCLSNNRLRILAADSAYDSKCLRKSASERNIVLHAATNRRRNPDKIIIRPQNRWVVEPSHSWLNNFRSLKICWTKTQEAFFAQLQLGSSILLFRRVLIFG